MSDPEFAPFARELVRSLAVTPGERQRQEQEGRRLARRVCEAREAAVRRMVMEMLGVPEESPIDRLARPPSNYR